MWLGRFIGFCQENVGLSEMRGDMTMFQKVCLKMTTTNNIEKVESPVLLGVTFQGNGRFTEHIKQKPLEANKCLHMLRSLKGLCHDNTHVRS